MGKLTDELGTLNFITADKVAQAASLVRHGKVFPLGVDFGSSGPQGAFGFRHNPIHVMTVDGGDANTLAQYGPEWARNPTAKQMGNYLVDNPFRFNDDMIIMPLQAATQWDALSHVYYDDKLYNGFPAGSVTSMGAYHCGIDKVDVKGITSRGVLLDLVRHRGAEVFLEHGNPISPEELDDVVRAQGVTIGRGDIVLIRTGWWARFLMTGNKTEAVLRAGLAMRLVAARSRDRGDRRRQPAGRRPGLRCRRGVLALAPAVPA